MTENNNGQYNDNLNGSFGAGGNGTEYEQGYSSGYNSGYKTAMRMKKYDDNTGVAGTFAIVIKCILAAFGALILFVSFCSIIVQVLKPDSVDENDYLRWCDNAYYKRDYRELYDNIVNYNLKGEKFVTYIEAAEGYELYVKCIQWKECEIKGIDGAGDNYENCVQQLKKLSDNPKDLKNKELLQGWYDEAVNWKNTDGLKE